MFSFAGIGWWVLQLAAPFMVAYIKWNRSLLLRAVVAVVVSWLIIVFYTSLIYNPAGVSAGLEQGMENPNMKYDNNTLLCHASL